MACVLVGECKAGTVHVLQLSVLPVILFPTVRLIVSVFLLAIPGHVTRLFSV